MKDFSINDNSNKNEHKICLTCVSSKKCNYDDCHNIVCICDCFKYCICKNSCRLNKENRLTYVGRCGEKHILLLCLKC